jgi:hypothetical protein
VPGRAEEIDAPLVDVLVSRHCASHPRRYEDPS